jgi:D-xylose transport system substrate-binding protein
MKRLYIFLIALFAVAIGLSAFKSHEKAKIGFLVHDLVDERWNKELNYFVFKVKELGGDPVTFNALGNAQAQVRQGKKMIDEGVKVIAVVAEDGKVLAELVDYADKAGAKIIAYDRMIVNCKLHYYISFDSERVGEMMVEHALSKKPAGNYVIINGPSSDNNAILIRKGIENKLKKPVSEGAVKVIMEKQCDAWYALNSMMLMDETLSSNLPKADVVIAGSDGLATGVIDAYKAKQIGLPQVITGQDASLEACRNIIGGSQSMTIFKSSEKIALEAAILAMKVARNEEIKTSKTIHNGFHQVPAILFDPIMITKANLKDVLVKSGTYKEKELAE